MVRTSKADLLQHGIGLAREIAVGKEQELDDRDQVCAGLSSSFRIGCGGFGSAGATRAERRCGYVSHVDLFEADC
jgi:hypothetical protein